MPKKYIYRKQMSGLLDYHGFRTQTEEFLNGIGSDIGDLNELTTTAKSNLVAAINEAAQSGGGGGVEEQFQKVYETTLTGAAASIVITAEEMGGVFVDVVVGMHNDTRLATETAIEVGFGADAEGEVEVSGSTISLKYSASWDAVVSVMSVGGLLMYSQTVWNIDYTTMTGWPAGSNIVYPSESAAGVASIFVSAEGGYILAGTTITVYARKPVTTPA